jgi:peptide chain release factor 3
MGLEEELKLRRTFGIISHPDAGKTTLTEKLLLFGGAINEAGAVKSNKIKKTAMSDFMAIEKQRGISVSTSVLSFYYHDKRINILDTPGHKDFAEDTYRTLTAVDSVILVIDVAKGVEEQTEKLVEVCRMRDIPIIIFINKLDREGKDAFTLLDEIEQKLKLKVTPLSFPIGIGYEFKGVFNIWNNNIQIFKILSKQKIADNQIFNSISDNKLIELIGKKNHEQLIDDLELIKGIYPNFNEPDYLNGIIQPVFFGSALNNFGIKELLDCFIKIAPYPQPKKSETRTIKPSEIDFSGFVFKIHANMDPKHRDRLAFIKIVSGTFKRNTPYYHVRLNKSFKFSSPNAFFGEKKRIIDISYPGDIIGIHDTGNFRIGDSITSGEKLNFLGIPNFSPEHFKYINNKNPMKTKQLEKGINQLMDEGVAQLFTLNINGRKIIGTVGLLQFEVIQYRLLYEYGAECSFESLNIYKACWIESIKKNDSLDDFRKVKQKFIAHDTKKKLIFLADSEFSLEMTKTKYPNLIFHQSSEY